MAEKAQLDKQLEVERQKIEAIRALEIAVEKVEEIKVEEESQKAVVKTEEMKVEEVKAPVENVKDVKKQEKLTAKELARERYLEKQRQYREQQQVEKDKKQKAKEMSKENKTEKATTEVVEQPVKKYAKPKVLSFFDQTVQIGTDKKFQDAAALARKEKLAKEYAIATKLAAKLVAKEKARKEAQERRLAHALAALEKVATENGVQILPGDTPNSVKARINSTIQAHKDAQNAILLAARNSEKLSKAKEKAYENAQIEIARKQSAVEKIELIAKGMVDGSARKLAKYEGVEFNAETLSDEMISFNLKKYKKHSKLLN